MINNSEDTFSFILAPLLDIMIFLLLFFMIAYSQAQLFQTHHIDMPSSDSSKKTEVKNFIFIQISQNAHIFMNGKEVNLLKLKDNLKKIGDKSKKILISGDRDLSYGKMMKLINVIKNSKFHKLYLVTKP